MTSQLKSFQSRRGATVSGLVGVALASVLLFCGAGNVPVENFTPQGPMQADLNAGNHSVTNAATVSATNFVGPAIHLTNFPSAATMGLGTAATNSAAAFDANGAAAAVTASSVQKANNGSDFASATTTRSNLGVPYNQVIAETTGNTVTTAQIGALFNYTTGSSALTPTIPSALSAGNGATYFFRKTDSGTGSVLVNGVLLGKAGHTLEIVSDGTSWDNRSFFGGIDSSGNISLTAPVNANISFNTSGTGVVQVNGAAVAGLGSNAFTGLQTEPSLGFPTGPTGFYLVCDGDSRIAGPQGVGAGIPVSGLLSYTDRLPAQLQYTGFAYNLTAINHGIAGTGVEDGVVNYAGATEITTTGNITANSNTVTITGSTTGLTGQMGIGGTGIPPGTSATISGSTVTLTNSLGLKPTTSVTGATLDFAISPVYSGGLGNQTPHEVSPGVTGVTGSIYMTFIGINDVQSPVYGGVTTSTGSKTITGFSGLLQIPPGYTLTGANFGSADPIVSNTATTITVSNFPSASGSTTVTVNPVDSAWETAYASLVSKALADSYKVVCVTIPKAFAGNWFAGDSHRLAFNAWILSTYGTTSLGNGAYSGTTSNVYVIDSASMSQWASNNTLLYVDGLHFTITGENAWSDFVNRGLETLFASQMTGPAQFLSQPYSIPYADVQIPVYSIIDPGNTKGFSPALQIGSGSTSVANEFDLGSIRIQSNANTFRVVPSGGTLWTFPNPGTSIQPTWSASTITSGMAKFSSTGALQAATAGTDYQAPVTKITGTLSAGTATITNAAILTTSAIFAAHLGTSVTNAGPLYVTALSTGSVTITSANGSDNDTVVITVQ